MTVHQESTLLPLQQQRNGSERLPPITPPRTPTENQHDNENEDGSRESLDSRRQSISENNADICFLNYKDSSSDPVQLVIHKAWKRHLLTEISSSGNILGLFDKYQYWIFNTRFEETLSLQHQTWFSSSQ